ncbi:MAG TPA: glycosyltransferase family 1 protein, partial [Candidatus Eisenbacteria bacterium]|nr:glycosyltransferase family 1 protein [Candidatus Eisenbacteria bacterium]
MKIAVDYQSAEGRRTGLGVYTENLVAAMREEAPDTEFLLYKTGTDRDLGAAERMVWESFAIPVRTLGDRPNVVFRPAFAPAVWSPVPQVVTIHDLIGRIFPRNLPPGARFYWSTWLPFCVRRARAVLANSECTRRDIERFLGIPASRVRVVLEAPGKAFAPGDRADAAARLSQRFGLGTPFFITVGTLEPRKNLPRLLRAFALYRKSAPDGARLALAGKSGGQEPELRRLAEELGIAEEVRFLGYVTDAELNLLYNAALGY